MWSTSFLNLNSALLYDFITQKPTVKHKSCSQTGIRPEKQQQDEQAMQRNTESLACQRRQWHEMCRSTKCTSSQAKNQEKRWYWWICELSTSQCLSLSSHTHDTTGCILRKSFVQVLLPHEGRTAVPQRCSGPDPITLLSGLVHGVKLQP